MRLWLALSGYTAQETRVLLVLDLPGPSTDLHGQMGAERALREVKSQGAGHTYSPGFRSQVCHWLGHRAW